MIDIDRRQGVKAPKPLIVFETVQLCDLRKCFISMLRCIHCTLCRPTVYMRI